MMSLPKDVFWPFFKKKYLYLLSPLFGMYCALSIISICAAPKTIDDVVEIIVTSKICEK